MENSPTTECLETAIVKSDDSIVAAENGHTVSWVQFMRWPRHLQMKFPRLVDADGWRHISQQQWLDQGFLRDFGPYLNWTDVMLRSNPPEDLVHQFAETIDWQYVFSGKTLSPALTMKYGQGLDWKKISQYPISEETIRLFQDEVDWKEIGYRIAETNFFSPQFIVEFADKLAAH